MEMLNILFLVFTVSVGIFIWASIMQKKLFDKMLDQVKEARQQVDQATGIIKKAEDLSAAYRKIQIETKTEIDLAQEHMAKLREQLRVHRKQIQILKNNQVRRYELALPNDFKPVMNKIKSQLKDL